MAVTITQAARKSLEKQETRQRLSVEAPKKALHSITPVSASALMSVQAALWALPARFDETLELVRRVDGRRYRVLNYNPMTTIISLVGPTGVKFDTKLDQRTENLYEPNWR